MNHIRGESIPYRMDQQLKLNDLQFTQQNTEGFDSEEQNDLLNYFDQMNPMKNGQTPLQRTTQSSHSLRRNRTRQQNMSNTNNNFFGMGNRTQINSQQSQRIKKDNQYNNNFYQNSINYQQINNNQPVQQLSHTQDAPKQLQGQLEQLKNKNSYGQYVDSAPLIKQNLLCPTINTQEFTRIFTPGVQSIQKQKNMNDLVSTRMVKQNAQTSELLNNYEQNVYTKNLFFDENQKQKVKLPLKNINNFYKKEVNEIQSTSNRKAHILIENFAKTLYQKEAIERLGPKQYFQDNQQLQYNDINQQNDKQIKKKLNFNNFNLNKRNVDLYKNKTKIKENNQLDKFKEIQNKINFKNVKQIHKIVVIEIYNLENIKRAINMKYNYIDIPKLQIHRDKQNQDKSEDQLKKLALQRQIQEFKQNVYDKLKLSRNRNIYFYLRDGTAIDYLDKIPTFQNTLLVGHCVTFKGIDNLFCSKQQIDRINHIMDVLEDRIQDIVNKEYRNMELENYKKDKNYESEYFKNGKFLTLQQIHQNQQLQHKKQSIFSKFTIEQVKEQEKKQEKNDMDPYIGVQEIDSYQKLQKYITKVRRFLDLFFTKYDNEWRQEKQQTEIDIYVDAYQQYYKEIKQKLVMDEVLDKFEKRKKNMQKLKIINCQNFCESLNKIALQNTKQDTVELDTIDFIKQDIVEQKSIKEQIMEDFEQKETENTEKIVLQQCEIHIFYILYKALLDVASYVDSVEDIIKKGTQCQNFNFVLDTEYIKRKQQELIEQDEFIEDEELIKVQTDHEEKLKQEYEYCLKHICDFENIINWNSTIQIVKQMSEISPIEKTQILMQIADEDRSGTLDKQEIEDLCYIVMDKMINPQYQDYKKELVIYFTEMFFSSLLEEGQRLQEVPMEIVKAAILKGREEADLLCFFCGASVDVLDKSNSQLQF